MNEKPKLATEILGQDYGFSLSGDGVEATLAALESGREAALKRFAGFAPWPDASLDAYFEKKWTPEEDK